MHKCGFVKKGGEGKRGKGHCSLTEMWLIVPSLGGKSNIRIHKVEKLKSVHDEHKEEQTARIF